MIPFFLPSLASLEEVGEWPPPPANVNSVHDGAVN